MSKKKGATGVRAEKKKPKFSRQSENVVEDLDLDVSEYFEDAPHFEAEDDRVLFNAKKGAYMDDDDVHAVLPNDAHRGVHLTEEGDGAQEEAELALKKGRKNRKALEDDDFAILDGVAPVSAKKEHTKSANETATLETVQRDFKAISSAERRALLDKESPELLKMLDEYNKYLSEVTAISKPLHKMIHNQKVASADERNLLAFLETKAQLLLSYCTHISLYLLLKAEGQSVANHPVIDRLVELRVYIEKLWPLEQKLQYSLGKMLSAGPGRTKEAMRLTELRPVTSEEGGVYKPMGAQLANDEQRQRRIARQQQREEEELRQAEEEAMTRVQKKKGRAAVDTKYLEHAAEDGYREDEDQFFSRMVAESSDEDDTTEHLSLIDKLRAKASKKQEKRAREESEADEEDEDGEMLDDMDEEGSEDDEAYEALVQENRQRDADTAAKRQSAKDSTANFKERSVDRRKISQTISTHRGLTKARPKDRKTPRTAQRYKYEKGLAKSRNKTKSYKPEPSGGFSGVAGFRPNVTHGTKL